MSDDELLQDLRRGLDDLSSHAGRNRVTADVREVCERWAKLKADLAAARAEAEKLESELDDATATIEALTDENDDLGTCNERLRGAVTTLREFLGEPAKHGETHVFKMTGRGLKKLQGLLDTALDATPATGPAQPARPIQA